MTYDQDMGSPRVVRPRTPQRAEGAVRTLPSAEGAVRPSTPQRAIGASTSSGRTTRFAVPAVELEPAAPAADAGNSAGEAAWKPPLPAGRPPLPATQPYPEEELVRGDRHGEMADISKGTVTATSIADMLFGYQRTYTREQALEMIRTTAHLLLHPQPPLWSPRTFSFEDAQQQG